FPLADLQFDQGPAMETLSLSKDFQGTFVGISNRIFHISVVHLQRNRKQCTREVIASRDNIERFHERLYRSTYSAQPAPHLTRDLAVRMYKPGGGFIAGK